MALDAADVELDERAGGERVEVRGRRDVDVAVDGELVAAREVERLAVVDRPALRVGEVARPVDRHAREVRRGRVGAAHLGGRARAAAAASVIHISC